MTRSWGTAASAPGLSSRLRSAGPPPQPRETAQRPPGVGRQFRRDFARHVHAEPFHARRPHPARADVDTGAEQPGPRQRGPFRRHLGRPGLPGAVVAPAAGLRRGIIELPAQVLHPAAGGSQVVKHGPLLPVPLGRHRRVALGIEAHTCPVATQPPLTLRTAPSTSRTFSIISSRARLRSTWVSSAPEDTGPAASASAPRVARTSGSGGNASEAK